MTIFLVAAISIATVLLFGCVGEIITEKSGHLNLGIPGVMCMGGAGGCLVLNAIGKSGFSTIFGMDSTGPKVHTTFQRWKRRTQR